MSNFADRVSSFTDKYQRTHGVLPSGPKGPDNTGEPPGGGMEARLARLEAHIEHAQSDLGALKSDMAGVKDRLARLEVKVDHLPSKGFIVTALVAALALITAMIGYQEQIRAILP